MREKMKDYSQMKKDFEALQNQNQEIQKVNKNIYV